MKVRIIGNVEHDGVLLKEYEVYDLSESAALELIRAGNAKEEKKYPKEKVETYIPQKVDRDEQGVTKPGQKIEATEPNKNPSAVKGIEPEGNDIKGSDKNGKGKK